VLFIYILSSSRVLPLSLSLSLFFYPDHISTINFKRKKCKVSKANRTFVNSYLFRILFTHPYLVQSYLLFTLPFKKKLTNKRTLFEGNVIRRKKDKNATKWRKCGWKQRPCYSLVNFNVVLSRREFNLIVEIPN